MARATHPFTFESGYVNFMMYEPDGPVMATHGDNYSRIVAVKTNHDPTNVFRVNQNISPTEGLESARLDVVVVGENHDRIFASSLAPQYLAASVQPEREQFCAL